MLSTFNNRSPMIRSPSARVAAASCVRFSARWEFHSPDPVSTEMTPVRSHPREKTKTVQRPPPKAKRSLRRKLPVQTQHRHRHPPKVPRPHDRANPSAAVYLPSAAHHFHRLNGDAAPVAGSGLNQAPAPLSRGGVCDHVCGHTLCRHHPYSHPYSHTRTRA